MVIGGRGARATSRKAGRHALHHNGGPTGAGKEGRIGVHPPTALRASPVDLVRFLRFRNLTFPGLVLSPSPLFRANRLSRLSTEARRWSRRWGL
jgi:hypothetical protein